MNFHPSLNIWKQQTKGPLFSNSDCVDICHRLFCCTHFWGLVPLHMQSFLSLLVCGILADKLALLDLVFFLPGKERQQENVNYVILQLPVNYSTTYIAPI